MIFRYPQIEGHIKRFHRAKGVTALGFESRQGGRAGELGHRGQQLSAVFCCQTSDPPIFLTCIL